MEKKAAKNTAFVKPSQALALPLIFLVTGIALLLIGGSGTSALLGWLFIFGPPLSMLTVILPHEFGHIIVAKLVGLRPVVMVIGNVWLRFVGPQPRTGLSKAFMSGGFAVVKPNAGLSRAAAVPFFLGGAIVNCSLVVVSALIYWKYLFEFAPGLHAMEPVLMLQAFGAATAASNLMALWFSLIPRIKFGFRTDGSYVKELFKSPPFLQTLHDTMVLSTQQFEGKRPRDWDFELRDRILRNEEHNTDPATALMLSYFMELDRGHIDAAESSLQRTLELADTLKTHSIEVAFYQAAFFYGYFRSDAERCSAYITKSALIDVDPDAQLLANAALAYAKADYKAAGEIARKFLLDRRPAFSPGYEVFITDVVKELVRKSYAFQQDRRVGCQG